MIVYLKPLSPFFKELPRSDTLFGAVCWGIRWIFGEEALKGLLERFDHGEPPFVLSSAFPYQEQSARRFHFFPRPILSPPFAEPESLEEIERFKRLKKTIYLEQADFNDLLNGRVGYVELCNRYVESKKIDPRVGAAEVPGNAINRLSGTVDEGRLFFNSEVSVNGGGLFFLVRCADEEVAQYIQGAVRFLGDRGIGGNSSVGRGIFEPGFSEEEVIEEPEQGERCVTLSLFHPTTDDLQLMDSQRNKLSYELVKRKGHVENMFLDVGRVWKETLLMFREGSVFPVQEDQMVRGCAPVVHRDIFLARHNGYAFTVRMAV